MNYKRGKETVEHQVLKCLVADNLKSLGWVVRCEYLYCDVVGYHNDKNITIAFEVERSTRNALGNLLRNKINGFDAQVIIVPNKSVHSGITHKLLSKHDDFLKAVILGKQLEDACIFAAIMEQVLRSIEK